MSKKVDEVEQKQNYALKNIDYKIDECKNQLKNQHNKIVPNQNDLQTQKDELQNNIAKYTRNHQEYKNKLKETEIEERKNENIIYTQIENIKNNEQIQNHNNDIHSKMVEASQYANQEVSKFQQEIGYNFQIFDQTSNLKRSNINIEKHKDYIEIQIQSIRDKLDVQMEQAKSDMNGASKSHIDTINSC